MSIARRTTLFFNGYLTNKGYAGEIKFLHEKKELSITVQLDNVQKQNNLVSDTRSLSGGERSFSTVALLLSLWEAMECPFRAMDEFDVFMDAVNRKISLNLLIDAASAQMNRQFIFITPHDISVLSAKQNIKIHRMVPPDRGGGGEEEEVNNPL